jgi:metal-dependent amidase/aminoacylase/carboxypeptidase family protein
VCAQGSDADNIIPDEVSLRGTLRALTHEHMMFIKRRIEEVSAQKGSAGQAQGANRLQAESYATVLHLAPPPRGVPALVG